MKLASFLSIILMTGFLFVAVMRLHPVGQAKGDPDVFSDRGNVIIDVQNVATMDDYFLRNGQMETGSNNIVTSVVFDYRAFDTLGEAAVLFIVVTSISMLLYGLIKPGKTPDDEIIAADGFPFKISRIVTTGALLLFPVIAAFGAYIIIHGHLSPGGGFQGGAILGTGTALLLASSYMTKKLHQTYKTFAFFESFGLTLFIGLGFAGIGGSFLYNFLANGDPLLFGRVIEMGPNAGFLNSGGILPLLSLAVGIEVFSGISIILIMLNKALYLNKSQKSEG